MQMKQINFSYEEYASKEELPKADREVLEHALAAVSHAGAQFSHFHVGSAARLTDGSIYSSSNKENTSIITCAEQNLLLQLHALRHKFTIETIAVTFKNMNPDTQSNKPITPCGKCRQLLLEAEDDGGQPMRIIMAGQTGKVYVAIGVYTLLPLAYSAAMLVS